MVESFSPEHETGAIEFLSEIIAAGESAGLWNLPRTLAREVALSPVREASYGPYRFSLHVSSSFPYLSLSLYPDALETAFTLGLPTRRLRNSGAISLGELILFHPNHTLPEDRELFYFREVLKEHPQLGEYFDLRPDGLYAYLQRTAFPWGSLVPEVFPLVVFSRIGMGDVYLDLAYPVAPKVHIPVATLSLSFGMLGKHVLSARR